MNDDVNAPAPVAHPADRMSSVAKLKAADLTAQGYEVAGYVLEKDDDRSAVLWDAAVRWVTPDERHRLMHVEGSLAAPAPVAQAGRSMRITGPDDDGLLWLHLTLESGQCAAFNLGTADRFAGKVAAEFSAPAPVATTGDSSKCDASLCMQTRRCSYAPCRSGGVPEPGATPAPVAQAGEYQQTRETLAACPPESTLHALSQQALTVLDELHAPAPVAWLYTLEYGKTVADKKVSLSQLNYPFGVCGADYLRSNDDGVSYVRQTPLYAVPAPAPVLTPAQQHADEMVEALTALQMMFRPMEIAVLAKIEATGQEGGKDHG